MKNGSNNPSAKILGYGYSGSVTFQASTSPETLGTSRIMGTDFATVEVVVAYKELVECGKQKQSSIAILHKEQILLGIRLIAPHSY
jgi:hypothetical protein